MDFTSAIKSGFSNYANFSGRASRSEYWYWFLFNIIVGFALGFIEGALGLYMIDPVLLDPEMPEYGEIGGLGLLSPIANLWGAIIYFSSLSSYLIKAINADLFGSYSILSISADIPNFFL